MTNDIEEHPCLRGVHRWGAIRHPATSEPLVLECRLCGHKIDSEDTKAVEEQLSKLTQQIADLRTDADGLMQLSKAAEPDRAQQERIMEKCRARIADVQNVFTGLNLLYGIWLKL